MMFLMVITKIIIPKEEPKQCDICKRYPRLEGTNKCESCYSVVRHVLEQDPRFKNTLLPDLRKKEETLEEAAENYGWRIKTNSFSDNVKANELAESSKQDFIAGAKWQAEKSDKELEVAKHLYLTALKEKERMYSEEEVGELVYNIIGEYGKHYGIMIDGSKLNELFEQFKKK